MKCGLQPQAKKNSQAGKNPLSHMGADTFGRPWSVCTCGTSRLRRYLEKRMEEWKARRGLLFFDDLSLTAKAVASEDQDGDALRSGLRDSFDADHEFQIRPVQFRLRQTFRRTGRALAFSVGDPKQSIYRFREPIWKPTSISRKRPMRASTRSIPITGRLPRLSRSMHSLIRSNRFFMGHLCSVKPNRSGKADRKSMPKRTKANRLSSSGSLVGESKRNRSG